MTSATYLISIVSTSGEEGSVVTNHHESLPLAVNKWLIHYALEMDGDSSPPVGLRAILVFEFKEKKFALRSFVVGLPPEDDEGNRITEEDWGWHPLDEWRLVDSEEEMLRLLRESGISRAVFVGIDEEREHWEAYHLKFHK